MERAGGPLGARRPGGARREEGARLRGGLGRRVSWGRGGLETRPVARTARGAGAGARRGTPASWSAATSRPACVRSDWPCLN
jgi:hypothetical protein